MLERVERLTNATLMDAKPENLQTVFEGFQDELDLFLEKLILKTEAEDSKEIIVASLNNYYEKCGKFFAEDAFYEERMILFWDLFLFFTPLLSTRNTEAIFHNNNAGLINEARFSLYRVKREKENQLLVIDELSGEKITVDCREQQSFTGLKKGDYLQGVLYFSNDKVFLSRGLIIHPHLAKKSLKKAVKQNQNAHPSGKLEFLCCLTKTHLRHVRHMHVSPARIYTDLL